MMDKTDLMFKEAFKYLEPYWKPKIGDNYFRIDEELLEPEKDCITVDILWVYQLLNEKKIFWKARQEDLQRIFLEEFYEGMHISTMVNKFHRWFWEEYNNKIRSCLEQYDWNEMWLCFIMETCFQKEWNGTTWE